MKRFLCLFLPVFLLSGCASTYRIENQAHAVSMGIDIDNGMMNVTVQVPNLGAAAQKDGGQEGSSYQIYSAQADNFEKAYNILQSSLPQQLNLTHLKTIVFSKEFAESQYFSGTISTFMNVFLVTGSANVIVTEKSAKTLIENQKPHIGIRLSITIPAMLSYHAENGYIPVCTLSNLYAGMKGRFSTALCALADTAGENDSGTDPFMPGSIPREGENKNEYMGAAIFDREKMVSVFNGYEMQLCYFLMGESNRIADFASPYPMRLSTRKKRDVMIDIDGGKVTVEVNMYLDVAAIDGQADLEAIEKLLERDLRAVVEKCKKLGVEPFGFSESAARKFKDNESFDAFDWLSEFRNADVTLIFHLNSEK